MERDRPGQENRDMKSFFTDREKERQKESKTEKEKRKHFSLVRTCVENAFGHG